MVEFLVFVLIALLVSTLVLSMIKLKIDNMRLLNKNIQLTIDFVEISRLLEKSLSSENTEKIEETQGFLNFVSQSRDWAFQYIENVQLIIDKFISDIEPEISYFDEYGIVGSGYPHYSSMKKISEAYKNLKEVLPEDYDKIEQ